MTINIELLNFLKDLAANNNREWFAKNKAIFDRHNTDVKAFFKAVNNELQHSDKIEKHTVFRIYRDVRFSKNKDPYKSSFNGYFRRATDHLRGGYFLNIAPGNSHVGGGFYGPNSADLKRIREEFEQDDREIRAILNHSEFKATFDELLGSEVKTAPRGFDKDHQAIDLIRKKQFYVSRSFSDKEVLSPDFLHEVIHSFKVIRPYFDYMSDVLTTDLNGESVLG